LFNLFVTFKEGDFDSRSYVIERGRFGEYTSDVLLKRYKALKPFAVAKLKSFPCLFVYEAERGDACIGYLTSIRERSGTVLVEYEFDDRIPPFPAEKLRDLYMRLDIGRWEMNRTHWAVKDEDLLKVLATAGLIPARESHAALRVEEMNFKVALSFPGENRDYVEKVARELQTRLPSRSVFYDRDFTAQLARPNLDTLLQHIYADNSDLVVVFLSEDYEKKEWCGLEWRAIRELLKRKEDNSIMFMRFDHASVPGALTLDGYVDLADYSPSEAAALILERVRLNEQPQAS
jgi:hypothetical protein